MSRRPDDLIDRVIGPAGPEVTCEQCFDELDRYVELELRAGASAAEAGVPGMTAHLQGCPACAEEHAVLRELAGPSTR
jgi:hypothetical protein